MAQDDKDAQAGRPTTGHEWDGIEEYNAPLPKWWLYTFIACILWAFAYWVAYPAWPGFSDYTKGVLGYSTRAWHERDLAAQREARSGWLSRFETASVEEVAGDKELLAYAMAGGRAIFAGNCAPCHGSGGSGAPDFPILADDDWIWGGDLESIETTIRHGIRSGHADERFNIMPNFGTDEFLSAEEIGSVAGFVVSLSGGGTGDEAAAELFEDNCAGCHGEDGGGVPEMGGPNLRDGIWLYGPGREAVVRQVTSPRHGVMPAWEERLDDVSIKLVAVYVHTLGGGQ